MKSGISYLYLCVSVVLALPIAVRGQGILGARPLAMGQVTAALPNMEWSLFANPALMDPKKHSFSFFAIRYYGFTELTDIAAAVAIPFGNGVVGAGAHRYGYDLFNESRIRAGYKNSYRNFHYGVVLNYSHVAQGGGYGSAGAVGVDAGVAAAVVTDRLWIGARASNLNLPEYGTAGEELPRELAVGFSWRLAEIALLASDLVKDVRFPASFRGGIEVVLFDGFTGRTGVTTEPTTFSLGFGYESEFWNVNIVAQNHQELGISPGLDLGISW